MSRGVRSRIVIGCCLGFWVACGRLELGSYEGTNWNGAGSGNELSAGSGGLVTSTSGGGVGGRTPPSARGGGSTVGGDLPVAARGGTIAGSGASGDTASSAGASNGGASNAGDGAGGSAETGGASGEAGQGGKPPADDESSGGGPEGGQAGSAGAVDTPPSCRGLSTACGVQGDSCCTARYLPTGTFHLGGDVVQPGAPAIVSSFYLDQFEVTIGRFRAFLSEYDSWLPTLRSEAGEHRLIPGTGWQPGWSELLPNNATELRAEVDNCFSIPYSTMTSQTADPNLPMNCVSWYEAFAFCIWDGGRLPTEAEWEYAATGGGENRHYPWGELLDTERERAVYGCAALPGATCTIPPVGSRPLGAARWGHLDLAGSMEEWAFDLVDIYPYSCSNCANFTDGSDRAVRGGAWNDAFADDMRVALRSAINPTFRLHFVGFRCAR